MPSALELLNQIEPQQSAGDLLNSLPDKSVKISPEEDVQAGVPPTEQVISAIHDVTNKISKWWEGAKAGAAEVVRAAQQMPESVSSLEAPGAGNAAVETMSPEEKEKLEYNQKAVNNFSEETLKPAAYTVGLVQPEVALPALVSDATQLYKQGGAGEVAKEFSGAGAIERANEDPNAFAARLNAEPVTTMSELLPAFLLGREIVRGGIKGVRKVGDLADQGAKSASEILDSIQPVQAVQGLDALDQLNSPTRGFRPATPDELAQWKADKQSAGRAAEAQDLADQRQAVIDTLQRVGQQKWDEGSANVAPENLQAQRQVLADTLARIGQKKWDQFDTNVGNHGEIIYNDQLTPREDLPRPGAEQSPIPAAVRDYINQQFGLTEPEVTRTPPSRPEPITAKFQESPAIREAAATQTVGIRDLQQKLASALERKDAAAAATILEQMGNPVMARGFRQAAGIQGMAKPEGVQGMAQPAGVAPPIAAPTLDTVTRRQILDDINKMVTSRTGRVGDRGFLGIFKVNPEVIRSRKYGDLEVLSHEVGHYLDKKLNLGATPAFDQELIAAADKQWGNNPRYQQYSLADKRAEGVAEFTRQYMVDPAAAQKNFPKYYGEFERILGANPDLQAAVRGIQSKMQTWYGQSPEARGRGAMSFGYETPKDSVFQRGKNLWYKVYEKMVDDRLGLAQATGAIEKFLGRKLEMDDNPYLQSRIAQSSAIARAQLLTEGKDPGLIMRTLNKIYGNILTNGVTIRDIVDSLNKPELSQKYPDYLKRGNFRNWTEAFDTYLIARRQLELQRMYPKYEGPMNAADAKAIVAGAPAEFQPLAGKFYQYHDNLMRIAMKEGMISVDTYNHLKKYKEYAPMSRDFSDNEAMEKFFSTGKTFGNVGSPIKAISEEGSARAVVSPLESTIKNTYGILSMVERNKVAQTFVRLSKEPGIGKFIEEVPGGSDAKKSIFTAWINGEKKSFQTSPEIYRAIMSMNEQSANVLTKIFSYPAGWLRAGATLTPDFVIRNLSRDTFDAAVYSKYGFIPMFNSLKGLADLARNKELYTEYKASGAQMATFVALDRDNIRQSIGKLIGESVIHKYNPIEWLRAFSEAAETATRLGEYAKARKAGASIAEAGLAAKDITVDFSRHGSFGKEYNKVAAFFNAAIQGSDRMVRAFREDPIGFNIRAGMYVTLPSVALWCLNHDQDWYKEEPEWRKNLFWMFKAGNTIYRIPKPFELGIIYGSLVERGLDYYYSKDPKKMSEWAKSARDGFLPNFMPTAAGPIVEWMTNYSFFREKAIVPDRESKLPNWMQFGPYTSETAKAVGRTFDVSPRKVDNTIQGYTGSLGKMASSAIDFAAGKYNGLPAQRMENLPGLRGFMNVPFQSPQSVQDFYDKLDQMEKDYSARGKNGNPPADLRNMRNANQQLMELHKKEREVLSNSNLSPAVKQQQLDDINMKVLNTARKALGRG